MIPIETVIELLMENASEDEDVRYRIMLGGLWYDSHKANDLRAYIREYIENMEVDE